MSSDHDPPYFRAILDDKDYHSVSLSLCDSGALVLIQNIAGVPTVRLSASQKSALRRILEHF